jgi:hypothetical protein
MGLEDHLIALGKPVDNLREQASVHPHVYIDALNLFMVGARRRPEILPPPNEGWEMEAGSRYDQIARCECA